MKTTITTVRLNLALLLVAVLAFAGCNQKVSFSGNFHSTSASSWSDWIVNGHRTITRSHDGVTRRLEMAAGVAIQNGQITTFPKAALIKIQESGGSGQRQAELRENNGSLELWIKDKEAFRRGSPEDGTWLQLFLTDVTTK